VPGAFNHTLFAEVGEMLGDLGLRNAQNFLEMANAKRTLGKQMDDPQPRGIAETLVNLNQFHGRKYRGRGYMRQFIYSFMRMFWVARWQLMADRSRPANFNRPLGGETCS
jgi:hypothetical protein